MRLACGIWDSSCSRSAVYVECCNLNDNPVSVLSCSRCRVLPSSRTWTTEELESATGISRFTNIERLTAHRIVPTEGQLSIMQES
jgi:hypothetical protein